jgi:hypothetical protein
MIITRPRSTSAAASGWPPGSLASIGRSAPTPAAPGSATPSGRLLPDWTRTDTCWWPSPGTATGNRPTRTSRPASCGACTAERSRSPRCRPAVRRAAHPGHHRHADTCYAALSGFTIPAIGVLLAACGETLARARGDQQSAAGLVYVASSAAASRPSPASRPGQVKAFGPVRRGHRQPTLMVPDGRPTKAEGMSYGPRERVQRRAGLRGGSSQGAIRHRVSSRPTWTGSRAKRRKTRYTRWSFPGLAHAATCDLGREDLAHGNSAADRMLHDQRLCNYRQDLTAPLPTPCPTGGHHGRPEFRVRRGGGVSR